MDITKYLEERRNYIDDAIKSYIPANENIPEAISESIKYSLLAKGKRLRPILVIASAEAVGGFKEKVIPLAVAVEMIHTYTLIHDDLPAIDNDDLRRGKPTNHKVFGEAMAILSGDALLTLAFEVITDVDHIKKYRIDSQLLVSIINDLANAVGISGTIGGQVVDILCQGKTIERSKLEYMHKNKTASLISACIRIGAKACSCDAERLQALKVYGDSIGLAFQIIDDILDLVAEEDVIGKDAKSDLRMKKATYPSMFGIEGSKNIANALIKQGIDALNIFDKQANILIELAKFIINRPN